MQPGRSWLLIFRLTHGGKTRHLRAKGVLGVAILAPVEGLVAPRHSGENKEVEGERQVSLDTTESPNAPLFSHALRATPWRHYQC